MQSRASGSPAIIISPSNVKKVMFGGVGGSGIIATGTENSVEPAVF